MNGERIRSKKYTTIVVAAALLFWIGCVNPDPVDLTGVRTPRVTSVIDSPPLLMNCADASVPMNEPISVEPGPSSWKPVRQLQMSRRSKHWRA